MLKLTKPSLRVLGEITERIRSRRRRERKEPKSLESLETAFKYIQKHAEKVISYCEKLEIEKQDNKQIILDAVCMSILRVGEGINKVEKMQCGFWEGFRACHFLDLTKIRNNLSHMHEATEEEIRNLKGEIYKVKKAIQNTIFPERDGMYRINVEQLRKSPVKKGEKPLPEHSMAMIKMEKGQFVIRRVGIDEKNELMVSSSISESLNLKLYQL